MAKKSEIQPNELSWLAQLLDRLQTRLDAQRLIYLLGGFGVLLVVADFVLKRKSYFNLEALPGFYALFGFAAAFVLIFIARRLRAMALRDERYYSPDDVESEMHPDQDLDREDYRA